MSDFKINKLNISFNGNKLVDISFKVKHSTALIGQSGSGKSLTLKAILDLLPNNLQVKKDFKWDYESSKENIAFIPQNPFTSLSPLTKIGTQFFEEEVVIKQYLKLVGLENWVLERFASQLSGGQLQRVVIAMALIKKPKFLLLDEPTTALDPSSKQTILNLLQNLQEQLNFIMLYVTHDINTIEHLCQNIVIIKDGEIIEEGLTKVILNHPKMEYTKKLISSNFKQLNRI